MFHLFLGALELNMTNRVGAKTPAQGSGELSCNTPKLLLRAPELKLQIKKNTALLTNNTI